MVCHKPQDSVLAPLLAISLFAGNTTLVDSLDNLPQLNLSRQTYRKILPKLKF